MQDQTLQGTFDFGNCKHSQDAEANSAAGQLNNSRWVGPSITCHRKGGSLMLGDAWVLRKISVVPVEEAMPRFSTSPSVWWYPAWETENWADF